MTQLEIDRLRVIANTEFYPWYIFPRDRELIKKAIVEIERLRTLDTNPRLRESKQVTIGEE